MDAAPARVDEENVLKTKVLECLPVCFGSNKFETRQGVFFCFLATITVITKAPDLWHETYSCDSNDTNSRRPLGISWDFNGFHMIFGISVMVE